MNMLCNKISLVFEPKRSIIPEDYHKTQEYRFDDIENHEDLVIKTQINKYLWELYQKQNINISGMCGLSILLYSDQKLIKTEDIFITVEDHQMQSWNS